MGIRITSKKDGFRRCGVAHPASPTVYPDGKFDDAQLAMLKAEPMLVVDIVEEKEMTIADYKALLDDMGIEYPAGAKKADLKALVEEEKSKRADGE